MSICAIVHVDHMKAANAALEAAGFGPGNFSVPCYGATGCTHAAMHAWDDPRFLEALEATPNIIAESSDGDPTERTQALIEAQGAKWGAKVEEAPKSGYVEAGDMLKEDGSLWSVIQRFDRSVYGAPLDTYPALVRRLRDPQEREKWRQPLDKYGAYMLVNAFTGKPDECIHNGKFYRTKVDVNVWEPAVGQLWEEIDAKGNVVKVTQPPVEEWPAWKVWSGKNEDLHQVGAKVSHKGSKWLGNTPNNHWEPGVFGWVKQP